MNSHFHPSASKFCHRLPPRGRHRQARVEVNRIRQHTSLETSFEFRLGIAGKGIPAAENLS